jgi:hypothetical protein
LGLSLISVLLSLGIKVWRWSLLLKPVLPRASTGKVTGALLLGQAANIVLPLRGGDLVRALAMESPGEAAFVSVLAGIAAEKAFDSILLALAAVLVLPLIPLGLVQASWVGLLVTGVVILVLLAVVVFRAQRIWDLVQPLLGWLPERMRDRMGDWGTRAVESLSALGKERRLPGIVALTFLSWVVMFGTNLILLAGFGLTLSVSAGLLVLVLVHIGLLPALMPGNIGPFYFFARLGLVLTGFASDQATAYAVVLHALVSLPPVIGAGVYLLSRRSKS